MSRSLQYRRKIDYVASMLGDLPPNLDDRYQFEALLYRLHTSIVAIMSILAMLVKDLGFDVGDDYLNIEKLESAGIIKIEMAGFLRKLNGLRNAIVHKYNKFDESIVREELHEVLSGVFNFLEVTENVLQKIAGGD
ncbi:MAG: HepT-like ribonuclease domain-containing protein [Candidatus Jordarchaeaceae archaeon]